MSEWQSPPIAADDEDWLRQLAAATDVAERTEAMEALRESFEMMDIHMPEDEANK